MNKFVPQVKQLDHSNSSLIKLSYSLAQSGHYEAALRELGNVQQPTRPELIYVQVAIGNIYVLQKRYNEALSLFQSVNKLDPLLAQGYLKIGNIFLKQGKLEDATLQFQQALDLAPQSVSAYIGIGRIKMKRLDYPGAVDELQRAKTMNPKAVLVSILLAEVYKETGYIHGATQELERVLSIRPQFILGYIRLGHIHLAQRNYVDSLRLFKQAYSLNEQSIEAKLGLAQSLIKVGELDAAAKLINEIRSVAKAQSTAVPPKSIIQMQKQVPGDADNLDLLFFSHALEEQQALLAQAL